jgi:ribosomal protein S18 acetylase RimI-like enzyme
LDITIRQFRLDDYDRAVALWQQAGLSVRPGDDRASIARLLERNPGLSFVAVAGGDIVGTVLGGFDGRRGYIYHLGVLPRLRRRGIARRLVREVEQRLAALGCPKLNLSVADDNAAAIDFYRSIGFEKRHIFMGKDLGPRRNS